MHYIEKETVLDILLKNIKERKDKNFLLYIHSPFCVRQCSFCIHKGHVVKINGTVYNKYFKEYVPNLIEFYKPVLLERIPDSAYFGGGTSSVMTPEVMRNILSKIPNFKDIKEKMFECNMMLLTDEKINILKEYNFTHVSFGVQTFDETILKKNNRVNFNKTRIKEMVSKLQNMGIYVNCDLMTFIDNKDETDIIGTINDFITMANYVKPNKISLYPERFALTSDPQRGLEKIKTLRKKLFQNFSKFNGYILPQADNLSSFFEPKIENGDYLFDYLFFQSQKDFDNENKYNSSMFPYCPSNKQTMLGIGSLNKSASYSYTEDVFLLEKNADWETMYKVIKKEEDLNDI